MGVMAFVQLLIAGVALAMRLEQTREVKVVEKIVPTPVPAPQVNVTPMPIPMIPEIADVPPAVETRPLPAPRPLTEPPIADPKAEALVKEARKARIAEDMMSAITKLQEALQITPDEPNALYELGQVHEDMGIYDKAREYYHKLKEMGTTGAGTLYLKASDKLIAGFEQPQDKINRIVLGRSRVFKDPDRSEGEKVIISIPVQSIPGENIDPRDLEVTVNFFDEVGAQKEIKPYDANSSKVEYKWFTAPTDWETGEELLQVTYTIPPQDVQQEHIFGNKRYYGQVVELTYKGELIDAQAWPRILAHKLNKPDAAPVFLDQEMPPDYNPENPLLPNISPSAQDPLALPSYDTPPPTDGATDLPPPPTDLPPEDAYPVPPEYQNLPSQ